MGRIARDAVAIRAELACVVAIAALHAAGCGLALATGFDHVSDDDFARVTIAQSFAVAPKLDPSGTSWLPFPFWWLGATMAAFGRSLAAARVASIAFASAAFTTPYLAMRFAGVTRPRALLASAFMLLGGWTLWLGAATVPESFTASFTTAAAIALGCRPPNGAFDRRRAIAAALFALGLLAACLSRYEPWPVAAVLGGAAVVRLFRARIHSDSIDMEAYLASRKQSPAPRERSLASRERFLASRERSLASRERSLASRERSLASRECHEDSYDSEARSPSHRISPSSHAGRTAGAVFVAIAALAMLGPLAWMAWNAHAHDGPFHFFRRVSNFKRAIGEGSTDTLDALLLYPRLLVTTRPEILLAAAIAVTTLRHRAIRDRWLVPLACAAAQLAFLAYGNARDGAPAHHAERALLAMIMILAAFAADAATTALLALRGKRRGTLIAAFAALGVASTWGLSLARSFVDPPGRTVAEDRRAQIERGLALRAEGAKRILVTPCAFEHFALIAAYGAPERVEIHARTGAPLSAACPLVVRQ